MRSSPRGAADDETRTLDRVRTGRGEIVLRVSGGRYEIISNGVFLMDTSDGASERLLVEATVDRSNAPAPAVMIGGLGMGFSLNQAVRHPRVSRIDVVEIEPSIIGWHERFLSGLTGAARSDPRVRIHEADVIEWLSGAAGRYDVICLDTDNGPNWLVHLANAGIYDAVGLDLAHRALRDGGLLGVWSASRDGGFEASLHDRFGDVEVLETPRERGAPDVVYVARRSRGRQTDRRR